MYTAWHSINLEKENVFVLWFGARTSFFFSFCITIRQNVIPGSSLAASWGRQSRGDPAECKGLLHRLYHHLLQYATTWTVYPVSDFVSFHYNGVIVSAMGSQNTSLAIVYSTVYSGTVERKHQSSVSLAFVRGIHRCPVNSPYKGPVTRKCFHLMTSSCSYSSGVMLARYCRLNIRISIFWNQAFRVWSYQLTW